MADVQHFTLKREANNLLSCRKTRGKPTVVDAISADVSLKHVLTEICHGWAAESSAHRVCPDTLEVVGAKAQTEDVSRLVRKI